MDFGNAEVRSWLQGRIRRLLTAKPFVIGFRVAGVDALLEGIQRSVNGSGAHYGVREFRRDYYRFFFDAGREIRGPSFVVMARPVDSYEGRLHFRQFSTPDVCFAGWVGDHPFTFAGMREAQMNVIHSARRGFVSFGSFIGGTPRHEMVHSGGVPYRGTEADVYDALNAVGRGENHGAARQQELLMRWLQLATYSPIMVFGGAAELLLGREHVAPTQQLNVPTRDISGPEGVYASLVVHRHPQLSAYMATVATHAFYSRVLEADHLAPVGAVADTYDSDVWVLRPLATDRVHFEAPVDWAYLLGPDIIVAPAMHSFGALTAVRILLPGQAAFDRDLEKARWPVTPRTIGWQRVDGPDRHGCSSILTPGSSHDIGGDAGDYPTESTVVLQRANTLVPLLLRELRLVVFSSFCAERPARDAVATRLRGSTASLWTHDPSQEATGIDANVSLSSSAMSITWAREGQSASDAASAALRLVGSAFGVSTRCDVTRRNETQHVIGAESCVAVPQPPLSKSSSLGTSWLAIESSAELQMWSSLRAAAASTPVGCATGYLEFGQGFGVFGLVRLGANVDDAPEDIECSIAA
jgi:hypothetical protein